MTAILDYLLNALWQLPLLALVATIIAALAARTAPSSAAVARHRVWVAALFLELILPATHIPVALTVLLSKALNALYSAAQTTHITVSYVILSANPQFSLLHLPRAVLIAIVTAYLTAVLYFVLRLLHGLIRTRIILREARDLPLNPAQSALLSHAAGPRRSIRIATSVTLPGPVTLGFTQPVLLLPPHFLTSVSEQDQLALFAHEAAHIRRHDFSLNLLYTALAVPIAFHPALWFTRNRLAETREMICDTLAARTLAGPEPYTQSLLRLALSLTAHPPASPLHAIGFLDANSFERRLMHLTELTTQPLVPSRLRRTLLASACAALALITCTSALALHLEAPAPVPSGRAGQAQVAAGVMAGQILSKVAPIYPAEAKANHDTLDGPVKLHALIGKDGTIQNIYVQQSLRRDYDASALEAVRQWVYKPYLLNGEPTEVETTITVTYSSDPSYNKK